MIVFCAEMTITGKPGRCSVIFGSASRPLPSGMITSEMTRSPFPSSTHRISVTIDDVACTLQPARVSAWVSTVRIVRSSSATKIVPSIRRVSSCAVLSCDRKRDAENSAPRHAFHTNPAAMFRDYFRYKREAETRPVLAT